MIALLLAAFAQSDDQDDDGGSVSEEVIVYAEVRVQQAKEKVINELEDMGYEKRLEKDGAVVMRHPQTWKGEVWLHDDGWMRVKRQPVQYRVPKGPMGPITCVLVPLACLKTGGQMVGKRKFMAVETRVVGAIDPDVRQWGDRLADLSVDRKREALPERLEQLWHEGVPLEPPSEGEPQKLETIAERKAAILRFWETRTDNPWGERIRETVEAFIRGEIQGTDDEFTDAELVAFNRRSRAGRQLDLERRRLAEVPE